MTDAIFQGAVLGILAVVCTLITSIVVLKYL